MKLQRLAFVCLFLASWAAFGQTRYVSDDIPVTLRTGPSLDNRIVRNLSAGTRVDVLGEDEDAGYSRVRVASDGTEGWILTRYLAAQPIARERLAAAERELAAARARVGELETEVASLTEDLRQTRQELEAAMSANSEATSELRDVRNASANAIALRDQNEELRRRLAENDQQISRLTMENRELESDGRQSWFMVGAGVLFGGILIGLIAPSFKRKRRSDW
ncbi:MAG: TIGR04211 family SH3 domain-containing protein [Gammaproteobacteria bacterium]|nr:TIGR04211 family SH3 domain-containing protein [Gammaproteobacteria bacterium]